MLDRMHIEGKIVFARSVFLPGFFFTEPHEVKGNLVEASGYLDALQGIARRANLSIAQLAFSFVNDLADVTSIVFGAATAEKVKQNIELSETNAMQNELRQLMRSNFDMVPNISPHRAFGL